MHLESQYLFLPDFDVADFFFFKFKRMVKDASTYRNFSNFMKCVKTRMLFLFGSPNKQVLCAYLKNWAF